MTRLDRSGRRALVWGGVALLTNGLTLLHLLLDRKVASDSPLDVDTTTVIVVATTAITVLALVASITAHRLPGLVLGATAVLTLAAAAAIGYVGFACLDNRLVFALLGAAGMINLAATLPSMAQDKPAPR
ncbi:hypothetical protein ABZ816_33705 [Actinosynnema sp. NPDC047251]|uniref:Putative membrane protein n=1 Tax=Saccharothrix espanaensis (strain ATCC 51144 / DSM 44229 / JCM 9112 / NBRC 15066 / NRRL 15764) TaxID=1179773 RepID=K0K8X9_SACES|nr:hypothetical protein [Saccharothrix espanaensis]CCH33073.1 putative membrane protein [Saccharothrix espanaensis DSM 44229]